MSMTFLFLRRADRKLYFICIWQHCLMAICVSVYTENNEILIFVICQRFNERWNLN